MSFDQIWCVQWNHFSHPDSLSQSGKNLAQVSYVMADRFQVVKVGLRQVLLGGKDNVHKWKKRLEQAFRK